MLGDQPADAPVRTRRYAVLEMCSLSCCIESRIVGGLSWPALALAASRADAFLRLCGIVRVDGREPTSSQSASRETAARRSAVCRHAVVTRSSSRQVATVELFRCRLGTTCYHRIVRLRTGGARPARCRASRRSTPAPIADVRSAHSRPSSSAMSNTEGISSCCLCVVARQRAHADGLTAAATCTRSAHAFSPLADTSGHAEGQMQVASRRQKR